MKEKETVFTVNGKEYKAIFNLNVMQVIQMEYGTFEKWGEIVDGDGEPDIKALIFGIREMINEAIDIDNEKLPQDAQKTPFMTDKQVGRLITEIGLLETAKQVNQAVIDSTQGDTPKNE